MTEREFIEEYLENIRRVLEFAVNNPYSSFYRDKYKSLNFDVTKINNYEEFKKIPYLTKDEIINFPLAERVFTKEEEIETYVFSSGTTSQNMPLIMPRLNDKSAKIKTYSLDGWDVENHDILVLFPPMSSAFKSFFKQLTKRGARPLLGDISNLKRTAIISKEIQIRGIISTPTILDFFLKELDKLEFDFSNIEIISLGGEITSNQKYKYFKQKMPNAKIYFRYGTSETGLRGHRCKYLFNENPNIYHPTSNFLEIVGDDGELCENEIGEIVYTDVVAPRGFPMIRYKTSDIGKITSKKCECGNNKIIVLGGRKNIDMLKFSGVTLYSEMIENALTEVSEYIEPKYVMHVEEEIINDKVMPKLTFETSLINQNSSTFVVDLIKESITKNLQLTGDKTLEYFVKNNIFLPLEVKIVKLKENDVSKSKNIISHLS